MKKDLKIGVIGLGYVGLPLAIELGKTFPLVGFDINSKRVQQLNNGIDETLKSPHWTLKVANYFTLLMILIN